LKNFAGYENFALVRVSESGLVLVGPASRDKLTLEPPHGIEVEAPSALILLLKIILI
jgi:hypothetical protein